MSAARPTVYVRFLRDKGGNINVGYGSDPLGYVRGLNAGRETSVQLIGLQIGGRALAGRLRAAWLRHQISRSWFLPSQEIKTYIQQNAKDVLRVYLDRDANRLTWKNNKEEQSDASAIICEFIKKRDTISIARAIEKVALDTCLGPETISKLIERGGCPSLGSFIRMTRTYGPRFLAAVMQCDWLDNTVDENQRAFLARDMMAPIPADARRDVTL